MKRGYRSKYPKKIMKRGNLSYSISKEDRISNLPDSIIHHILSFMYTKDVVQTCVLSKRWQYMWTSMPVLKFLDDLHYPLRYDMEPQYERGISRRLKTFVDKVLYLRDDSDIQEFHLNCSIVFVSVDRMYRWIAAALRYNVRKIYIETDPGREGFEIPLCLCNCESLREMELKFTDLDYDADRPKIILPGEMSLPRLKRLHLKFEGFQRLAFCNLQFLELQTYLSRDCLHSIFHLLQISPNVESLSLKISKNYDNSPSYPFCDEVKNYPENNWDAGLSLPWMIRHLKFVEIEDLHGCVNELKFLEILLKHGTVLEKVVLASYSTGQDSLREKQMKKFREMLLAFPRASKNIIIFFKI